MSRFHQVKQAFSLGGAVLGLLACAGAANAADPVANPTFTKDIAPIFQEKCEACHRPGSIAPMSLQTYEEARPWTRSIRARVEQRQMPPWHIDKTVGIQEFDNDRSLSDDQITTILRWVDQGAVRGNASDMPARKVWPDGQGWNFAAKFGQTEPDMIITSPDYTMPARGQDAWDRRVTPTGITEPRWVRAIEIRPKTVDGRRITHHAIAYLRQDDPGTVAGGLPAPFMEWAVGKEGELMRPDTGKLLVPGSMINWDIHYSTAGEEITSAVELGIYFYPKGQDPKYRNSLALVPAALGELDLKPNTLSTVVGETPLRQGARIESFQAHMHLRGTMMMVEAVLPSGETRVLSKVSNFNFNWHNTYVYTADAAPLLPKGTILRVTATHDNTTAHPSNPDPNQWVGWGDRTVDEMAHAWINIVYMSDPDFESEVQKRAARSQQ